MEGDGDQYWGWVVRNLNRSIDRQCRVHGLGGSVPIGPTDGSNVPDGIEVRLEEFEAGRG